MVVAGVTSSKHDVHIPGYFRGSRGRYSPCWYGGGGSGSGGGGGGGGGDGNRKDDVEYTPTPPPAGGDLFFFSFAKRGKACAHVQQVVYHSRKIYVSDLV